MINHQENFQLHRDTRETIDVNEFSRNHLESESFIRHCCWLKSKLTRGFGCQNYESPQCLVANYLRGQICVTEFQWTIQRESSKFELLTSMLD